MSNYNVNVKGFGALSKISMLWSRNKRKMFSNIIKKMAFFAERKSKENITSMRAVDTGRLRSSIFSDIKPFSAVVGPNTNYAYMVHEGLGTNSRIGRRPYMELAAEQLEAQGSDEALKEVEKTLDKIVDRVNLAKNIG